MIAEITKGTYDSQLDQISQAIQHRKKYLASLTFFELTEGDRIKIKGITPKYWNGLTGKVIEKKTKRILIEVDKAPLGCPKQITVPPVCLEKI